jgi:phage shock protein A
MIIEAIVVGGVLLLGSLIFPRPRRLVKGALGMMFNSVEEANPEVLFQAAKDDYRKNTANMNQALANFAGQMNALDRQVKTQTAKKEELEARIQANIDAGNTDLAATLASQLETIEHDLSENQRQLTDASNAYKGQVAKMKQAEADFKKKVQSFQSRLSQAKINDALATAGAALQDVAFKASDQGDTFNRAEEILNKRADQAAGKARVVSDLAASGEAVQVQEAEQKALDKAALAKFLAKRGKSPSADSQPAEKQMGPVAS